MAKTSLVVGTTSYLARVFIQDSSSTTGAGLTGLVFNTSNLVCYRARDDDGNAAGTAITLATATRGTWTSGGFVEKDATNMPGVYEFGVPNAALATGSKTVTLVFKGATNMAPLVLEYELTATNNQDAVRGGMTALPNANAEAAGGLYTRGTGAGQINQPANGMVDTNMVRILGTAVATPATAGVLDVNAKAWNNLTTVALPLTPTTAGRTLDVSAGGEAGIDWANVGSPTTSLALTGTTIATTQKVDVETIKTNPVVNGGTITFPTTATLASTTNITAGTVTTATNVTTVNGLAANVITAASTAADYVTEVQNGLATASALTSLSGKFTGITSVTEWLGAMAGKQAANSTALTEIRATGAGSGTYAATTDSLEALKDDQMTEGELQTAILTSALTESYAADGAAPTLAQICFQIWSFLSEKSVSSTTLTAKKLDGSTTSMTFTLSDATNPVSITRAS
jgi:hypothetical protein